MIASARSSVVAAFIGAGVLFGAGQAAWATGNVVTEASVGWSWIRLPDTDFTVFKNDGQSFSGRIDTLFQDHDGTMNGVRVDGSILAPIGPGGMLLGVSGFFADQEDTQTSGCIAADDVQTCGFSNLFDPDPNTTNMHMEDDAVVTVTTLREVMHYGVSLEARTPDGSGPGNVQWRGGLSLRAIDQNTLYRGTNINDGISGAPASNTTIGVLDEDIDTHYYGAFAGLLARFALGPSLNLVVDAEGGLYYAHTDYRGRYNQTETDLVTSTAALTFSQSLSLDDSSAAAIGRLKVELEKDFGGVAVAGFVMGEWYSYAPKLRYNNTDSGAGNNVIEGINSGTRIDHGQATAFTVGGRLTVPIGGAE